MIHAGNGLTWNQVRIEVNGNKMIILKAPGQEREFHFPPSAPVNFRIAIDTDEWKPPDETLGDVSQRPERAEDGRLDRAPIFIGGVCEHRQLRGGKRQGERLRSRRKGCLPSESWIDSNRLFARRHLASGTITGWKPVFPIKES